MFRVLTGTETRWLMVFDNVLQWEDISGYMPSVFARTRGSVLITSQVESLISPAENITELRADAPSQKAGSKMENPGRDIRNDSDHPSMSGPSLHHPDRQVHELRDWIQRESLPAHDITRHGAGPEDYQFLPRSHIEHHFQANNCWRAKRLLQATFLGHNVPVNPRAVAEHCPRVFCILTLLGKEHLIRTFVQNPTLWDVRLPFEPQNRPRLFPKDEHGEQFYDKFTEAQWRFCAQNMQGLQGLHIEDERILPFLALAPIGSGGSATVYQAQIHQSHNGLVRLRRSAQSQECCIAC